ncbi:MAG TPA: hypothetical protein VFM49_25515 [Chloroflexia bacterium]|nr:hypothetical protein [Chloroflexia bacterium]
MPEQWAAGADQRRRPAAGGVLYAQFGGAAPFWFGAAILILGIGAARLAVPHLVAQPSATAGEVA